MARSLQTLLESWSSELSSRANRVRSLIGDAHWLSDGLHKERLIQDFISTHLPSSIIAEHGFFLDLMADRCSPEIDVFVRDSAHSSPLLSESGISICDPRAVLAYWEVKSDFSAGSLSDALNHISKTQTLMTFAPGREIWRAACFMTLSDRRDTASIVKTLTMQVKKVCSSIEPKDTTVRQLLPTCIICLDSFCAFIVAGNGSTGGRIKFFATERLSFSAALADMLAHVYSHTGITNHQPLEEALDQILSVAPQIIEF